MVKSMLGKAVSRETKEEKLADEDNDEDDDDDDSDDDIEFLPTYRRYHAMKFQKREEDAQSRDSLFKDESHHSPESIKFSSPRPMNLEIDSPTPPICELSTPTDRTGESPEEDTSSHPVESTCDDVAVECRGTDKPPPVAFCKEKSLPIYQLYHRFFFY